MSIAVISDIHGNLEALETVLKDIEKRGICEIFCTGDLVGYAPFPNEVIELIKVKSIPSVMGNYDDGVGFDREECGCAYTDPRSQELGQISIAWTKNEVTSENKRYLQSLPAGLDFALGGYTGRIVHGSPRKINEYLFEDKPETTLKRIVDQSGVDILVCGHTHKPYHKVLGERHLVNAGSVGKPKHGTPEAVYVILTEKAGKLEVEFVRVPYNVEITARAIEKSALPGEFAQLLREGRG